MNMPKALIILAQGFEDIEAVTPIDLMRRAKIDVTVVGLGANIITGARGIKIQTNTTLKKIKENFDAVILPGGMPGAENLANSKEVKSLLLEMHSKRKIIAAICASPALVLSPLGILNNKKATCFKGMEDHFEDTVTFVESTVVVDNSIITSRGAGTAFDFGLAIIEKLVDKDTADSVARTTLYK